MKKIIYSVLCLCLCVGHLQAQLFIDNSVSPEQMVAEFFTNSCVSPTNITFKGNPASVAYFEAANTDLGINAGIVITSGNVLDLPQVSILSASGSMQAEGDTDLEGLLGAQVLSNDAAVLEFDIMVSEDGELSFEYIFGSEEYPEFVGGIFNDVFGFFLSDASNPSLQNIAYVPNTMTPVAINNVNDQLNSQYYVPYSQIGGEDVVFDGLTTKLPALFNAQSNTSYHVKIAVADLGDNILDSGVFIGIESLCGESELTPPALADVQVEGQTVSFTNSSRYATSWHWDFGDNTTSEERNPEPHTYAEPGIYTVTLTTQNWCCTDTKTFVVDVSTTSTEELTNAPFSVQPNPASDKIVFQSDSVISFDYEMMDYTGKVLEIGNISGGEQIDLAQLNEGMYLLKVKSDSQTYVERIVVRR